jgi:DNA-directed RNA polymerase subunit beta
MYQNFSVKRLGCYQKIEIKKNYASIKIPILLEVQCVSFFRFLKFGLKIELQRRRIWYQNMNFEWIFYPERLCFEKPNQSYQEILRLGGNYRVRIFIPRSLCYHKNNKIRFEWIVLGNLPLLTQQGYFLVNGSPRVCIAQIIRGPGIYISKKSKVDRKSVFYVDFVPERGTWVRLEKDYEGQIWIRIRKEPRVPLGSILQTIGLLHFPIPCEKNKKHNSHTFWEEKFFFDFFLSNLKKKKIRCPKSRLFRSVSNLFQIKKIKLFYVTRKFSSIRTYDLGEVGRRRFNEQFQQILPLSFRYLVPTDFLAALKKLTGSDQTQYFDDIDSLRTRRLRRVGDFLQIETRSSLLRLERRTCQRLNFFLQNQRLSLNQIVPLEPFDQTFRRFISVNPLLQFADQLNSLSELTQKRRLTGLGPGGLNLSNRKIKVRTIHPSHFGRLCPVETPEGQNAGIVSSPTLTRRLSRSGCLQVLIGVAQNGWIQFKLDITGFSQKGIGWVSQKKGDWMIRFAIGLLRNTLGQIQLSEFSICLETEIENLFLVCRNQVELVSIGSEQRLALGPNLIPFLEHDDRNRVLMGSNILRQAIPILKVSVPRVLSKFNFYIRNDTGQTVRSRWSGFVFYVSSQRILVYSNVNISTIV